MDQAVAAYITKDQRDDTYPEPDPRDHTHNQCQQVAESQEGIRNLVKLNLGQCSSTSSAKIHIHSGDQSKTDVNCKLMEGAKRLRDQGGVKKQKKCKLKHKQGTDEGPLRRQLKINSLFIMSKWRALSIRKEVKQDDL